ncbi:MAG: PPE domain-containing protein [Actinomycetia bacterium]|nr:PPE domain-containing protein [Actinomycetes bacterium]
MVGISFDAPALAAHGRSLAAGDAGVACEVCQPAAPDTVSTAVAGSFTAWAAGLDVLVGHSAAQRVIGGAAVAATGQELAKGDAEAACTIASYGQARMSPGVGALPASPDALPAIPVAPPLPAAPSPVPAEVWSQQIHGGPGSAPLRNLARQLQSRAATLSDLSDDTERAGRGVDANWNEGDQPAGRKIVGHALWLRDAADYARGLASSAESAAATVDNAQSSTPSPETFRKLRIEYLDAVKTYVNSGGTASQPLATASANIKTAQGEALGAQSTYALAAQADTATVPAPPSPPPPIVDGGKGKGGRGGGSSAEQAHEKNPGEPDDNSDGKGKLPPEDAATDGDKASQSENAEPSTPPEREENPGVDGGGRPPEDGPAAHTAPRPTDAAANSAGEVVGTLLGAAAQSGGASGLMPPGAGGSPMSALSGFPSMPSTGGLPSPGGGPQDLGLGEDLGLDDDLFETSPASAGGAGGAGGGAGGLPAGTSVSASAASPPPPATPSGAPPATSASSSGGGRMGGMYPPMMGGAGNSGPKERDKDMYPDRRVVHREIANTEPVLGELEQLRKRPSRRRSARTQEENNADDTGNESA